MEEKNTSVFKHALNYGLFTGVGLIIFSLITYVLELHYKSPVNYLAYLIFLGFMIYGALNYKKNTEDGYLSYGKAFSISFQIALYGALIAAIYGFVFISFFDDTIITQIMENSEQELIARGMSDAEIERALGFTEMFASPGAIAGMGLFMNVLFMTIASLITSIFVKKEDEF